MGRRTGEQREGEEGEKGKGGRGGGEGTGKGGDKSPARSSQKLGSTVH